MSKRKKFSHKTLGKIENQTSYKDIFNGFFGGKNWIKFLVLLFCLAIVVLLGKKLIFAAQTVLGKFSINTVGTISSKFGEEMKKDELGNVNILLVGYGGGEHQGALLADSIMVASWDPKLNSVTMISVPRDLYVNDDTRNVHSRINTILARAYNMSGDVNYAAGILSKKMEDITGLEIPYYAVVDFDGFEQLVDTLGGIDIYVEHTIHDETYPDGETGGYKTFHIDAGQHHVDGATALKYARSRHTTSDFSRSARQQQILKVVFDKLFDSSHVTNVAKLKKLYNNYVAMVDTNIQLKEIVGMFKYIYGLEQINSFVLTTECSHRGYNVMVPGCFLYTPARELFNGKAVLLPSGATPGNVSFYDYIRNFVFVVAYNQKFLAEDPKIIIENGIDKNYAYNLRQQPSGHANKIGVKLVKYGFDVVDVDNAPESSEQTVVYINSGSTYPATLDVLKMFVDIKTVYREITLTGVDMIVVLGNDYIDSIVNKPFNYSL